MSGYDSVKILLSLVFNPSISCNPAPCFSGSPHSPDDGCLGRQRFDLNGGELILID